MFNAILVHAKTYIHGSTKFSQGVPVRVEADVAAYLEKTGWFDLVSLAADPEPTDNKEGTPIRHPAVKYVSGKKNSSEPKIDTPAPLPAKPEPELLDTAGAVTI